MENQHRKITGYRELTQQEIDLMNEIKDHGIVIASLVEKVQGIPGADLRWASIAKTHLQEGFMALTRSVAKPTSF